MDERVTHAAGVTEGTAQQVTNQDTDTRPSLELVTEARVKLNQLGQGQTARLLDALYVYGAKAGQVMTEKMVNEFCHQHIRMAKKTVRVVLKAEIDGHRVFAQADPSAQEYEMFFTPEMEVKEQHKTLTSDQGLRVALVLYMQKGGKKPQGRPSIWYLIPDPRALFRWLRVEDFYADVFTAKDMVSKTAYGAAVHRTWIIRKPGEHYRRELGRRLGVKPGTTRHYDKRGGVAVERKFHRGVFNAKNIDHFKWGKDAPKGAYLVDIEQKRFPATRDHAQAIIAQEGSGLYIYPLANDYWVPGYEAAEEE